MESGLRRRYVYVSSLLMAYTVINLVNHKGRIRLYPRCAACARFEPSVRHLVAAIASNSKCQNLIYISLA